MNLHGVFTRASTWVRKESAELFGPDIRFIPLWGRPDIGTPIASSRSVRPSWLKSQYANPPLKLARCPGMWDYMNAGYIIPAHCDIHIKVNSHGISVRLDGANNDGTHPAVPMDFSLIDGLAPIDPSAKKAVFKIPVPWGIFAKRNVSAMVIPAVMHSEFLDKLHVYPGVVDYDNFHTVQFIFSGLKECEFTIWAGEPLLQVIPFARKQFSAEVGVGTTRELAEHAFGFFSRKTGLYRRMFQGKKTYSLIVKDDK